MTKEQFETLLEELKAISTKLDQVIAGLTQPYTIDTGLMP